MHYRKNAHTSSGFGINAYLKMHKCISNEFDNIKPVFGAFLLEKYRNSGTRYIGNEKWYMNPRMKTW